MGLDMVEDMIDFVSVCIVLWLIMVICFVLIVVMLLGLLFMLGFIGKFVMLCGVI